jgi:hypothetical protein
LTRNVQLPKIFSASGGAASGTLHVVAIAPLRWTATGETILQTAIDLPLVNGMTSIDLPVVQEGFESLAGAEVLSFTYTFSLGVPADSSEVGDVTVTLSVSGVGAPYLLEFSGSDQDAILIVRDYVPVVGLPGVDGLNGSDGATGATGPANALTVGTVTSVATTPTVEITGVAPNQVINFGLPKGDPGTNAALTGVKSGGTAGQYYVKTNATDFEAGWVTPPTMTPRDMPLGGTTGQVLVKSSAVDRVTGWATISVVPAVGTTGQVLTVVAGAAAWASPASGSGSGVPAAGNPGQVVKKISTAEGDAGWGTDLVVPAGGTSQQVIVKNSATEQDASWTTLVPLAALPIGIPLMAIKVAGAWPARPSTNAGRRVFWDGPAPYPAVVTPPSTTGMYEGDFIFDVSAS